jgi:hypothetical protein
VRQVARLLVVAGSAVALAAASIVVTGTPAVAATGGGECSLSGTANFDGTGLTASSSSFTYNFAGTLSSCNSNSSGAPTGGTVAAGSAYQVTQSYSVSGVTYSATYALPEATGSGSCAESTTSGTAVAFWSDGTATVVGYTTTGAAAAVELQGSVVPSVQLVLVSATGPTPPPPPVITSGPDFPAGDGALGQLVFSTDDPAACQTGLTTASISGVVGIGSAQ